MRINELLALTSIYEELPIGVLEALAYDIPVVSIDSSDTSKRLSGETEVVIFERAPKAIVDVINIALINTYNFPSKACVQLSKLYWAKTVVFDVYDKMRKRWKDKHSLSNEAFTSMYKSRFYY